MRYLVVDISTTAQPQIEDSPYLSWANKKGSLTPEEAYSKAGLHAEYGMICGLSAFWVEFERKQITREPEKFSLKLAFSATASSVEEEEKLLLEFEELLEADVILVGHNSKDFIIPFLAKRYLGNGLLLPRCISEAIYEESYYDIMRELACGGVSVMSLRSSAWLFGIDDPRASVVSPKFYQLCKEGQFNQVEWLTRQNAEVAAKVFGNCVLGKLINI